MKRSLVVLALSLALTAPLVARGEETLTREQMKADLDELRDVLGRAWAYTAEKKERQGVDLGKLAATLKESLPATATRAEFARVLDAFVVAIAILAHMLKESLRRI